MRSGNRAAVDKGDAAFLGVVRGLGVRIMLDALTVFARWITPALMPTNAKQRACERKLWVITNSFQTPAWSDHSAASLSQAIAFARSL